MTAVRCTRRHALRAGVLAVATGLAGCPLAFGGTSDEVAVTLTNGDDAAHDLSVTVAFDGATLLERSVTLDPDASREASFRNPESTGSARVRATLGNGTETTESVRVGPGTGIRSVTVEITGDGDLSVFAGRT